MPEKKVTTATVAAAVVTIVIWLLQTFADVDIPPEVALAISTVVVAIAGYLAPHTDRPDLAPAAGAPAETPPAESSQP